MPSASRQPNLPAPNLGALALDYLGDAGAAEQLRGLLRVVAERAAVERRERSGAKRAKNFQSAAKQAVRFGKTLTGLDERTLISAIKQAALPTASSGAPGLLDGFVKEPLHRQIAAVAEAPDLLVRLSAALEGAADEVPVGSQGRPERSDALNHGIESLATLWRDYRRGVAPSQGATRGRFGALAAALFAGAPCGFGEDAVRHAVAEMLPSTRRSRGPAQQPPAAPALDPRQVLIIGADTGLGRALAAQYREVGAKVVAASWDAAATAFPTPKARKVKLLPAEKLLHEDYALVVLIPPEVDAAAGNKVMSAIALEPEQLLRALLERPAGAPPERIVLLSPVVPLHTAGQEKDLRFLRAARAAQLSFIRSIAASTEASRTIAVAIAPAWGTGPDGVLLRASGFEAEARILVTTIAGISFDRTGEILDLHGSRLPF